MALGIGKTVGVAQVVLKADTSNLTRGLANAERQFDTTTASMGRKAAALGKAVLGGAALATAAGLGAAVKAAIDFDRAMRNVNSIARLNERQFRQLSKQVLSLAKDTGQAPRTLAAGMYDLVSSGFKASDAVTILATSSKAATAGLTDTATSTKAVAAALNAYHLRADSARRVSDVLFQTVNKGVLTFEELAQNMGDLVPAAAPLGVSLEEVGAAIATITLQGVPAAEAATRVKNTMIALAKPSKDMTALLKANGFESGQAAIKALGYEGVLRLLDKATHGNVAATAKLTPEIRAMLGIVGLTGKNLQVYENNLRSMNNATQGAGATSRAFAEQSKSLGVQWDKTKAAIVAAAIPIGQLLFPAIRAALTQAAAWVEKLQKNEAAQQKLKDAVAGVTRVVKGAIQAGKDLAPTMVAMARAADRVAKAVGGWDEAFKLILGGVLAAKLLTIVKRFGLIGPAATTSAAEAVVAERAIGTGATVAGTKVTLLRGQLAALGRLGAIGILIDILIHKNELDDWFKSHGLGFLNKGLLDHGADANSNEPYSRTARSRAERQKTTLDPGSIGDTPGLTALQRGAPSPDDRSFDRRTPATRKRTTPATTTRRRNISYTPPTTTGGGGGGGGGGGKMGGPTGGDVAGFAQQVAGSPGANAVGFHLPGERGPYDCSAFTQAVFRKYGVTLGSNTYTQQNNGVAVARNQIQPGDLLFFTYKGEKRPGHVGIYIGGGQMVHDHGATRGVSQTSVDWAHFNFARRVIRTGSATGPTGGPTSAPERTAPQTPAQKAATRASNIGAAGPIAAFEAAQSGTIYKATNVKGIGKILAPLAPTVADWGRVKTALVKKLKSALKRRQAVARSLARATKAKHKDKILIANLRGSLGRLDKTIRELRIDIGTAIASMKELVQAAKDDSAGEGEAVAADTGGVADLPVDVRESLAEAGLTADSGDDLAALDQAEALIQSKLDATTPAGGRLGKGAVTDEDVPTFTGEDRIALLEQLASIRSQKAGLTTAATTVDLNQVPAPLRLALAQAEGTTGTGDDLAALGPIRSFIASRLQEETDLEQRIELQNELNSIDSRINGLLQDQVDGAKAAAAEVERNVVGYLAGLRGLRDYTNTVLGPALSGSTIHVNNYFPSAPDPLSFSRNLEFELRTLV